MAVLLHCHLFSDKRQYVKPTTSRLFQRAVHTLSINRAAYKYVFNCCTLHLSNVCEFIDYVDDRKRVRNPMELYRKRGSSQAEAILLITLWILRYLFGFVLSSYLFFSFLFVFGFVFPSIVTYRTHMSTDTIFIYFLYTYMHAQSHSHAHTHVYTHTHVLIC